MAKKKNVTKHATNVNNNRNEVHIHLGDKKNVLKKERLLIQDQIILMHHNFRHKYHNH